MKLKPLDLIETDDLLKELFNRFDSVIFRGIRFGYYANGNSLCTMKNKGSNSDCVRLASKIIWDIHREEEVDEYDPNE